MRSWGEVNEIRKIKEKWDRTGEKTEEKLMNESEKEVRESTESW